MDTERNQLPCTYLHCSPRRVGFETLGSIKGCDTKGDKVYHCIRTIVRPWISLLLCTSLQGRSDVGCVWYSLFILKWQHSVTLKPQQTMVLYWPTFNCLFFSLSLYTPLKLTILTFFREEIDVGTVGTVSKITKI